MKYGKSAFVAICVLAAFLVLTACGADDRNTGDDSLRKVLDSGELVLGLAVADSYDAMSSTRSYRGILPQDVVRDEIEKGKGTQFDPRFAEIMLQIIDEDKEYNLHGEDGGLI